MNGWLDYPRAVPHPKNYSVGRQGYQPLWFVVHCTDTEYADNYPANLGKYWQRNPVQVSVHFAVSDTMTYQYVSMADTAYQARNPTNLRGVGVEIVGKASWSRNEWLAHKRMLRRAAQLCAEVTLACGLKTEPALLSVASLKARNSGLTCHRDVTNAFQGTHTDPGSHFPWDYFTVELRNALRPVKDEQRRLAAPAPVPTDKDALMAVTQSEFDELVKRVARLNSQCDGIDGVVRGHSGTNLEDKLAAVNKRLDVLAAAVEKLSAPKV